MNAPLQASARLQRLAESSPREYLIRFVFGGLITVSAGLVAVRWGPGLGGLFLAFPSILPASLTLVSKHSKLTASAGADGLGAVLGSFGLLAFALVVWLLGDRAPAWLSLGLASLAWLAVSAVAWAGFELCHRRRHQGSPERLARPLLSRAPAGSSAGRPGGRG